MLFSINENAFFKATLNRVAFFVFVSFSLSACAEPANYAFISNQLSNDISVIDIDKKTVVSTITVGTAPAGVALSPNGQRVLISNPDSQNISVLDARQLTEISQIPVAYVSL